jgi:hypothetical protein
MLAKALMLRSTKVGVAFQDASGDVARGGEDRAVLSQIGDEQAHHTALLRAFDVSRPAQAQVCLGDGKAVIGLH